ncbi:MAG: class I fructose-bisphosphate aldolase [Nocardioidaceae bacterium]
MAKWRAVFPPVDLHRRTIGANAHPLASYAALCQEADIVPIVEPEVLMDGEHDVETCPEEVARRTLQVLRAAVPPEVPGVAFVSGGHSNERACANLAAINGRAAGEDAGAPWRVTFSFGRALVADALQIWRGDRANVADAQAVLAANSARAGAASDTSDAETVGV